MCAELFPRACTPNACYKGRACENSINAQRAGGNRTTQTVALNGSSDPEFQPLKCFMGLFCISSMWLLCLCDSR